MRHTADGGFKAPGACGETLSERNTVPAAFNLNQSSAVCLPLVTDMKRLIWVHSDQINLKMDGAAELDKAFDRFPYLTQRQTAALAQRCSLHPDQVRVWFMVQRLRYGISWDYIDIPKVRTNLSRGKKVQQKNGGEADKRKSESGGKKAGEVREEQTTNEGRMKQEQPVKGEKYRKVEKDTGNTQKKRKRAKVTDKKRKRRRVEVEIKIDEKKKESTKSTHTPIELEWAPREKKKVKGNKRLPTIREWAACQSFVVPDEALDAPSPPIPLSQTQAFDVPPPKTDVEAELEEELHGESTNSTDVCKPGVTNNFVVLNSPTQLHCSTKLQTQREMMKRAFAICQYPDTESYEHLAELIGIPRCELVRWYGDMRYYVKERKPGWLTKEQHSQALANIRYRQFLTSLVRSQQRGGGRKVTLKTKLERSENCGVDQSVQVAPEQK